MKAIEIEIEKVISEHVKKICKDMKSSIFIAEGWNFGEYLMLSQFPTDGDYFWTEINCCSKYYSMFGDDSTWESEERALRAALYDGKKIMVFECLREFCEWYLKEGKKSFEDKRSK